MPLVGDRFEILSLAGHGGMGRVFRARDTESARVVALKLLSLVDFDTTSRFERESGALAHLDHPGIVRFVARGTADDGAPFLAMEWVEGEELRARLKREGRLEAEQVVALAKRLAAALAHAHERGIVHRDVKPGNVVLPSRDLSDAVLIDFGLARTSSDAELTQSGMLVGTPIYMAPEQVRDNAITPSVDVFALACVMYQCLAQVTPFAANGATAVLARVLFDEPVPVERLAPETPPALAELVGAMLRKSPLDRPSMREVAFALDDSRARPEVGAARHAAPQRRRAARRQRDRRGGAGAPRGERHAAGRRVGRHRPRAVRCDRAAVRRRLEPAPERRGRRAPRDRRRSERPRDPRGGLRARAETRAPVDADCARDGSRADRRRHADWRSD